MYHFKNIGVVINLEHSNENILQHAEDLARKHQTIIHLLCPLPRQITDSQKNVIEDTFKGKLSCDFDLVYLTGKPMVEVVRHSAENQIDLLLIEPDEISNKLNRFFHGSLSLSLLRQAPCPVWVVKKPLSSTYQRILIAVDTNNEQQKAELNDKLIQYGLAYAQQQSAECYLVTAWALEGESMLKGALINTSTEEIDRLKMECKIEAARAFESLQKRHHGTLANCQTVMLNGNPGYALAEFVQEKNIDLIIMGTIARSGLRGFVIGNTAETVINHVDCSIMAIKPDGFIPPVLQ